MKQRKGEKKRMLKKKREKEGTDNGRNKETDILERYIDRQTRRGSQLLFYNIYSLICGSHAPKFFPYISNKTGNNF